MRRGIYSLPVIAAIAAAGPALAANQAPRLVVGSVEAAGLSSGDLRQPLLSSGSFSLGALSNRGGPAVPQGRDRLAVGSYVSYGFGDTSFESSLRSRGDGLSADVSAAYAGTLLGIDGTAALRLGADWNRSSATFSPNASQAGLAWPTSHLYESNAYGSGPYGSGQFGQGGGDVTLSLSWMHDITPSLSLGGMASASHPVTSAAPSPGFMLGAGFGYRF